MASCPKCLTMYPDGQASCPTDGEALVPDEMLGREPPLKRGEKVGEYVIERTVGTGTFGSVYGAIQPLIGKQVAVKVLSRKYSADPHVVSRFIAEARAVNQIRHRNIIDIFSFGQLPDGRHYHVMELLDGVALDAYVARAGGRLEWVDLFPVLRGLGRALDAAHVAGIAHRDLKPANVFLARDEQGRPFPKLLDFGIAKLLTDDLPRQHHTATGAAVGTPDYMSPEQCQGPDVDHRTDIYSFGVLTYQLATGQLPFRGKNVVEVLMQQMTATPELPSKIAPHVPPELDAPIMAMLAKSPEARPPSLHEAVRALEEAALAAGLDLPTSITGDPLAPQLSSGPHALRSGSSDSGAPIAEGQRSVAMAATMPSISRDLIVPTEAPVGKRSPLLLMGIAAVAIAIAAVPFVLDTSGSTAEERIAELAPAPPPPPAKVEPLPTHVSLHVTGAPDGTEILGPEGKVLGHAPGAIELERSSAVVNLTFKAPGYEPQQLAFVPASTATVAVALEKTPPPARRSKAVKKAPPAPDKPGKDDLEVPAWAR